MSDNNTDLKKSESSVLAAAPEATYSGPVYTPAVDIFETDSAITVLADMPGVQPEDLTVDLRERVLTLLGRIPTPENQLEDWIVREHGAGTFMRQFTLSETIDQAKIEARLNDGVLRLELPKVEKAKPRQIAVRAG
jgi:HSP20 family protein